MFVNPRISVPHYHLFFRIRLVLACSGKSTPTKVVLFRSVSRLLISDPLFQRDMRNNRVALFDGIEEGGIRATSSYSHEIDEHDNERAMEGLQDRVSLLKRLSGDVNEEVESHNRMLDRMGNDMDASRGILSRTMDRFKMVFKDECLSGTSTISCHNNEFDLPLRFWFSPCSSITVSFYSVFSDPLYYSNCFWVVILSLWPTRVVVCRFRSLISSLVVKGDFVLLLSHSFCFRFLLCEVFIINSGCRVSIGFVAMELLHELTEEMTREFMENADQLDSEERHRACCQLMFLSEIEEEFRKLKQENEKLRNQNKKGMERRKKLESQLKEMEDEKKRSEMEISNLGQKLNF
ncbi:hypothetical protein PTKIN_Ptkin12aG0082400 [Pterospermum kingtungense]